MTQDQLPIEVAAFLEAADHEGKSPSTTRAYRSDLVTFARWFEQSNGEAFTPAAVTPTDIRSFRAYQQVNRRLKPATVNRRLSSLHRFFHWAEATGCVERDPTDDVAGVATVSAPPRWLDRQDLNRLTRTLERHGSLRDVAIIQLLRQTGIRVGELVALTTGDVHLGERSGKLVVRAGKGNKYREVPLNLHARKALQLYLDEGRPVTTHARVFIGQRGPLTERAVQIILRKYAGLAGLEGVTPHTLRHSFGKTLVDAGEQITVVAALLGHESLKTTMVYTQPGRADLEAAVGRLESL
jgi:site-specific recombinase XerD